MNISEERIFIIGMWWRIGYGMLRILLGLALLKVIGMPLIDVMNILMSHELVEDSNDVLYSFFTHLLTNHPLYVSYFLSVYFIFWGVVDVVLSYNLIKHRMWAFPISFALMSLFILYEIFRFGHTYSLILLSVILIDSLILWIVWREYKRLKNNPSIKIG